MANNFMVNLRGVLLFFGIGISIYLQHQGYFCRCHSVSHSNLTIHWGYEGNITTEYWCSMFPLCCGNLQSPINVVTATAEKNTDLMPLVFKGLYAANATTTDELVPVTVVNTARTAEFRFSQELSSATTATGGCLGEDVFTLVAFHFHWGEWNGVGSEHTVDGQRFPLEMHVLHRNVKYANMDEAKQHADGLAVIAVFFTEDDNNTRSPLFASFASQLPFVHYAGHKQEFLASKFNMLLPSNTEEFFCYFGSLTTPTCDEVVTWTLLKKNLPLDDEFLWQLRHLEQGDGPTDGGEDWPLVNNFRPVQPLHSRTVIVSA